MQCFITFHVFTVRIYYLLEWDESIVVSHSNQWSTLTVETFHKRWTTALPSIPAKRTELRRIEKFAFSCENWEYWNLFNSISVLSLLILWSEQLSYRSILTSFNSIMWLRWRRNNSWILVNSLEPEYWIRFNSTILIIIIIIFKESFLYSYDFHYFFIYEIHYFSSFSITKNPILLNAAMKILCSPIQSLSIPLK